METIFQFSGNIIVQFISYIGLIALLLGKTLQLIFVPPYKFHCIFKQLQNVGPGSFVIAALVCERTPALTALIVVGRSWRRYDRRDWFNDGYRTGRS